jgi:hypothetical protein
MPYVFLAIVGLAIAIAIFVLFSKNFGKPKLNSASATLVQKKWAHVQTLSDPHRKILEADAVLDLALKELGFKGSLGDKLKKAGKYLPDENAVWRAHKLRNRIAHEPGTQVGEREVSEVLNAIEKGIKAFIRQ